MSIISNMERDAKQQIAAYEAGFKAIPATKLACQRWIDSSGPLFTKPPVYKHPAVLPKISHSKRK